MQLIPTAMNEISTDLQLDIKLVEAYYRNFYINRTSPIRDLTPSEIQLAKLQSQLKYYAETDLASLCLQHNVEYKEFQKDNLLLPKAMINMKDEEYLIVKKYYSILLEPYFNFGNTTAPRLTPLTEAEIAMLLTNIAVGKSILPNDIINARISMEAMDRLLRLYESLPKDDAAYVEANKNIKKLNPTQLQRMIEMVSGDIEIDSLPDVPDEIKPKPKTVSQTAKKKITGVTKNAKSTKPKQKDKDKGSKQ